MDEIIVAYYIEYVSDFCLKLANEKRRIIWKEDNKRLYKLVYMWGISKVGYQPSIVISKGHEMAPVGQIASQCVHHRHTSVSTTDTTLLINTNEPQ